MLLNCGDGRLLRRSNQSILKKINPEYSLEGLMLKLKLQYFRHLMQRKAGGEGDDRGQDGWMASLTQWTWIWASSSLGCCKESDTTEWRNNSRCRDCPLLPKMRELRHDFSGQFQANFYWNIRNIEAKGSHHKNSSALQTNPHPGWAHRINSYSKWNSGKKVRECGRMKGRKDQRKDPRAYLITPKCTWYLLQKCRSYRSNPGNWGRCLTQVHKTGLIWALGSSLFK